MVASGPDSLADSTNAAHLRLCLSAAHGLLQDAKALLFSETRLFHGSLSVTGTEGCSSSHAVIFGGTDHPMVSCSGTDFGKHNLIIMMPFATDDQASQCLEVKA